MSNLRYLTAGESHGRALISILEGIPAGLSLTSKDIDKDLLRRQKGYGRGGRMKIEKDTVQILSGVRWGKTLGSPLALLIENKDWPNWEKVMSLSQKDRDPSVSVTRPRPGHADLTGGLKYGHSDLRNVLERSSARETASRVALGAIARKFLSQFSIEIMSYVVEIGGEGCHDMDECTLVTDLKVFLSRFKKAENSDVRCPDKNAEKNQYSNETGGQPWGDL
jgi:chorismate synthase